jgi:branched-chain amino acid transport system permease protein
MPLYVQGLIVFGVVYVLLASAIHIPLLAGYLFLPQAGLMLIAAYTGGALARAHVPWPQAALAGIVASVAAAAVIGLLGLRLKDFPLAIATIAVGLELQLTITSTGILGGVGGLSPIPRATTWQIALAVLIAAMLLLAYYHTSYASRQAMALGNDEIAARAFGVRPGRVRLGVALLSGLLCGVSGVLYAAYVRFIDPGFFGFATLVLALMFTIVGGSRNMFGPLLGVILLWPLPQYLGFAGPFGLIVYSVIVVAILMLQPAGLTGLVAAAARRLRQTMDSQTPKSSRV